VAEEAIEVEEGHQLVDSRQGLHCCPMGHPLLDRFGVKAAHRHLVVFEVDGDSDCDGYEEFQVRVRS
jgi:hypothetical protein